MSAKANIANSKFQLPMPERVTRLEGVLLPSSSSKFHDVDIAPDGRITAIEEVTENKNSPYASCLVLPSLCHPHVHLDKPHLLTHPSTSKLQPEAGTFPEALKITAKAKEFFTFNSVLERMHLLLADSIRYGVTALRAFCEVDATVDLLCIEAGLAAKKIWANHCDIQICAFAQDPIFSGDNGEKNRALMEKALQFDGVDVLGVTPYVEDSEELEIECVRWAISTSKAFDKLLDFHLDYNVEETKTPRVWDVLTLLKEKDWASGPKIAKCGARRTVCLGHCTRLTLFSDSEWTRLLDEARYLPVYLVGLPTSDLFMMARPEEGQELQDRKRTTLQIPSLVKRGFRCAIGVNNVGNAFTPYGTGDPLELARWGVGIYQVGTQDSAIILYECISVRAKRAIGLAEEDADCNVRRGEPVDLVVIGKPWSKEGLFYRRRKSVQEVVWDAGCDRIVIFKGNKITLDI